MSDEIQLQWGTTPLQKHVPITVHQVHVHVPSIMTSMIIIIILTRKRGVIQICVIPSNTDYNTESNTLKKHKTEETLETREGTEV